MAAINRRQNGLDVAQREMATEIPQVKPDLIQKGDGTVVVAEAPAAPEVSNGTANTPKSADATETPEELARIKASMEEAYNRKDDILPNGGIAPRDDLSEGQPTAVDPALVVGAGSTANPPPSSTAPSQNGASEFNEDMVDDVGQKEEPVAYQGNPNSPDSLNAGTKAAVASIADLAAKHQQEKDDLEAAQRREDELRGNNGNTQGRASVLASLFAGMNKKTGSNYLSQIRAANEKLNAAQDRQKYLLDGVDRLHVLWAEMDRNAARVKALTADANAAFKSAETYKPVEKAYETAQINAQMTRQQIDARLDNGDTDPDIQHIRNVKEASRKALLDKSALAEAAGRDLVGNISAMNTTIDFLEKNGVKVDALAPVIKNIEEVVKDSVKEKLVHKDPNSPSLEEQLKEQMEAMREFFANLFARIGNAFGIKSAASAPRM